jgi:hypothetical protein
LRDLISSLPDEVREEEDQGAFQTAGASEGVEVHRGGRESEASCAQERAGELVTLNDSPARPVSRSRSVEGTLPAIAEHYQEAGGGIDEGYTDEDFEVEL